MLPKRETRPLLPATQTDLKPWNCHWSKVLARYGPKPLFNPSHTSVPVHLQLSDPSGASLQPEHFPWVIQRACFKNEVERRLEEAITSETQRSRRARLGSPHTCGPLPIQQQRGTRLVEIWSCRFHREGSNEIQRLTWQYMAGKERRGYTRKLRRQG